MNLNNHDSRQRGPKPTRDNHLALHHTGFTIVARPYRVVRDIMAEFEPSEKLLRDALRIGHGIEISDQDGAVNMLFFVLDSDMRQKMKDHRIDSPTWLQLLGTTRVISTTEKDAEARFRAMLSEDN